MAQFRRSKKLGGLRITGTKGGMSVSGGTGFFRLSKNSRGETRTTTRIPGTGIYNTTRVGSRSAAAGPDRTSSGTTTNISAIDLTGGTRTLLDRDDGVATAELVGLREHKTSASSLAEMMGIGPSKSGRPQGIRDAILVPQGDRVQVMALVRPEDNPRQFKRKEIKAGTPRGVVIGRLSKKSGSSLAEMLDGQEALVALYIDATPGMELVEVRWKPALFDDEPTEEETTPN